MQGALHFECATDDVFIEPQTGAHGNIRTQPMLISRWYQRIRIITA